MKIKRLSTISFVCENKIVDSELPSTPDSKFIVDDSHFCPMSEAVKQLSKISPVSADELRMYYDFPSGRDNGKQIPFERSASFSDITELSNSIIEDTKNIAETMEKERKKQVRSEKLNSILNKTDSSSTPSVTE